MARRKRKSQKHDNPCFGPVRRNTVVRCNSCLPQQNCVARGTPSCTFRSCTEVLDKKDILVHENSGIVYCSRSDAHTRNNRPIPTTIVTKSCLNTNQEPISIVPRTMKETPSTTITIFDETYVVDFIKEKLYKKRNCIMHSINSWKHFAQLKAINAIFNGKNPKNCFARSSDNTDNGCGWIICNRCKRAVCSQCAKLILLKASNNAGGVSAIIQQSEVWLHLIVEFLKVRPPDGRVTVIQISPTISHCCRLGCEVRSKRNQTSRANHRARIIAQNLSEQSNDGLLHYAPYRIVIATSFRFYESLCVAQQGSVKDEFYQKPVYHSVIPNDLAKEYNTKNVFPYGHYNDVVLSDFYSYVPVAVPFQNEAPIEHFMVRRVLIKFSDDYTYPSQNGTCCLSDQAYFTSCFRVFDEEWETYDIKNDVDVCLITGQPGPGDIGKNKILLSGRIYANGFEIPFSTGLEKNDFLNSCFESINKKGFETQRLGGSAGIDGATADQLKYFKFHRGSFPNIAGAVFHRPLNDGNWKAYYISPYKTKPKELVAVHKYSTPKPGGHVHLTKEIDEKYPMFFERMSKVRSTMASILISLRLKSCINISPIAAHVQKQYNNAARIQASSLVHSTILDHLKQQVVYSFVAYTVGNHKDVTKKGCAGELIECKACIQWPEKSFFGSQAMPARGRGGAGPGIFTVMIVDHPNNK
jgi:hypothetical protein